MVAASVVTKALRDYYYDEASVDQYEDGPISYASAIYDAASLMETHGFCRDLNEIAVLMTALFKGKIAEAQLEALGGYISDDQLDGTVRGWTYAIHEIREYLAK